MRRRELEQTLRTAHDHEIWQRRWPTSERGRGGRLLERTAEDHHSCATRKGHRQRKRFRDTIVTPEIDPARVNWQSIFHY